MKKYYLLLLSIISLNCFSQGFGSYASGIRVGSTIYNITGSGFQQVNPAPTAVAFDGASLGNFSPASSCGKITAAEIKTWKNLPGNVCSATLHWRVYATSGTPGSFNSVPLNTVTDCNTVTSIYNDNVGACSPGDQKWKDYNLTADFLNGLATGSYTLEIYLDFTGSDTNPLTCETDRFISNGGANYKASFTVSATSSNPIISTTSICEGNSVTLTANPSGGTAPYTFSWTGPNGYTSTAENPIISNTTASNAGAYSLIVTDACGVASAVKSTAALSVTARITPTFDAILFAICNGSTPPLLSNSSTNGITGTWNPAVVSNTSTGTYIFTPDPGFCANPVSQTIFVVTNVMPAFSFPTNFCYGATPPALPAVSSNGIVGTWSPSVLSTTSAGTYTFTPNPGQCALVRTVTTTLTINNAIFDPVLPFCQGTTPVPVLATTSNNGITGTWNPATISNQASATYSFTPDLGQCAPPFSLSVTIIPLENPTFNPIAPICAGSTPPALPGTSTNGISGIWNPAVINNTATTTYTFTANAPVCANPVQLTVVVNPVTTPVFDPFTPICKGETAPLLPATSNNGVTGTWSPATISNTASGTYTFTPNGFICADSFTLNFTVNIKNPPVFPAFAPICVGGTAPVLPAVSNDGFTGTWSPANVSNTATGSYTFTPNPGQCALTLTVTVLVQDNIAPQFNAIAPFCANTTAPLLPSTSNNNITGTWSPATVSNTASGTYTFTPDAGQCAIIATLNITVLPIITPAFSLPAMICENDPAPALPAVSNNNVTGTWSPATVSNTVSGSYTFTPNAGECAIAKTFNIDVNPKLNPQFDAIPTICAGSNAPVLPAISNNGISGTWNPAVVSNTATDTYTFTPASGQCAFPATLTVTVMDNITPIFDAIPPFCANSTAPTLPAVSNNGVTGTWNPATISNTASGTYTFTPDAGQCGLTFAFNVTVLPILTPSFTLPPTICENDAAPVLPLLSNNNVPGTWSPATVSTTASGTYTFTPDAGQCAVPVTITINVSPSVSPAFNAIAPICSGATAPALQAISNNGVTGTWNPAVVSNTATATYTFTPDAGQCALPASITVTVNENAVPEFDAIAPLCANSAAPALPAVSNNGISGMWVPAAISNTASGTYTFTPDAGQCALQASITVTVNPQVTPSFNLPASICAGSTANPLPAVSADGYTGTWTPSAIDNTATTTYTFTPDTGQCALPYTTTITVNPVVTPQFDIIAPICPNVPTPAIPVPPLPTTSNNGIPGTWSPAVVDVTASGSYTFTPNPGICATPLTITVTVLPVVVPVFDTIGTLCPALPAPVLPTVSNNGVTGTWSPAIVSNMEAGNYTFTPDAGQCSQVVTMHITIGSVTPPFFIFNNTICAGDPAPTLPASSAEGITGTWSPAIVDNMASGTYVFTPDAGQCSIPVTVNITVNPVTTPVFTQVPPLCPTSAAPVLPLVSNNGITGTWNPATVSLSNSDVYTFTPDAGQCAVSTTMSITVLPVITPTFPALGPICTSEPVPALPIVSDNGISGTWAPAVLNDIFTATYNFTPNPGQCAQPVQLTFVVNQGTVPAFSPIAPVCKGGTVPALPVTSNNGITGTWSPATISNSATTVYTFTPNPGQCAVVTGITVSVTNPVTPTFSIPAICAGSVATGTLPSTSDNGITGTWLPTIIDVTATADYVFTPDAGECATPVTVTVTVNPTTVTHFDQLAPICSSTPAPELPTTSTNGITGTWNPSVVDNTATATYTFMPDGGQCGTTATMEITVYNSPTGIDITVSDVEDSAGGILINSTTGGTAPFEYSLNDGAFTGSTQFTNLAGGDYTVTVKDANGCTFSEMASISATCKLPRGISPNNDGDNDTFKAIGCNIAKLELFNRYGTKVNSFSNYNNTWDGTSDKGELLPTGTYFYVAEMQGGGSKTGWVYLIR